MEAPPHPCHPERSRGTCIAPLPNATAQGSRALPRLRSHGSTTPPLSSPHPCHPERSRGTCIAPLPNATAQAVAPSRGCALMEAPPHPCHHPTLVIPSVAEGPALRPSRTQLPRQSRPPAVALSWKHHPTLVITHPCHPERKPRDLHCAPPERNCPGSRALPRLRSHGSTTPPLSSPHPCHPERSRGTCIAPLPNATAISSPPRHT